jgi:hypothetical protein
MIGVKVVWRILYTLHTQICDKNSGSPNEKYLKISGGNERKQICYLTQNHRNICVAFFIWDTSVRPGIVSL